MMRASSRESRSSEGAPSRGHASASPRSLRGALSAAFLVTIAGLVSTTTIPLVTTSAQVRELIRLGDDHAQAVEILSTLRGRLSVVRTTLVRIATGGRVASWAEVEDAFRASRALMNEMARFADTPTERHGLDELRGEVDRCEAGAQRVQSRMRAGDERAAVDEIPWVVGEISSADGTAQRLVTFNAAEVQASARKLRESLWRVASISAVLAAIGFGAAVALLRYARAGFRRYSAALQARAEEMAAFAGRAAHELRNPLQTVSLSVVTLRAAPGNVDALGRVEAGLRRLARTIDKLLEFAAAGGDPEPDASCDVAPVVDDVVSDLGGTLSDAGVEVERDIEPSLRVGMDAAHLRAVVSNLVTNAAKYGCGAIEPRIRISAARRDGRWAEIAVADDGPGIPPAALPRVFDPLFRATSAPGGFGLGLATTKRLVEAHGGTIAIESERDRGTTVRALLPARES